MPLLRRPWGDTDMAAVVTLTEAAFPYTVTSIPPGQYEFGRLEVATGTATVSDPAPLSSSTTPSTGSMTAGSQSTTTLSGDPEVIGVTA